MLESEIVNKKKEKEEERKSLFKIFEENEKEKKGKEEEKLEAEGVLKSLNLLMKIFLRVG